MRKEKKAICGGLAICCVFASLLTAAARVQSVPATVRRVAVRSARMLDVKTGAVVQDAGVLIEGGRIKAAGTGLAIPSGTEVVDLGEAMLLPGLIDAHTHLLQNYDRQVGGDAPNMILTVAELGTAKRALLGAKLGREMVEAGFTTVRDLGNSGFNGDVALRDAIQAGWVVGPRIYASTRALSLPGGQFGTVAAEAQRIIDQEYAVVSGPEEARRAVRQAFYDGADLIKVIVEAKAGFMAPEELKAIVAEAHRFGRKVAAHSTNAFGVQMAVEAGADSIEHAYDVAEETLKVMAQKRIFLVPTDFPLEYYVAHLSGEERRQTMEMYRSSIQGSRDRLKTAVKLGVPIAAGSDAYAMKPGATRGQNAKLMFRAYAESGMSPIEIIRAATVNNAELLAGRRAQFGAIEPGKFADLIAVPGDPLKDITELDRIWFVMKEGVVVRNDGGNRTVK